MKVSQEWVVPQRAPLWPGWWLVFYVATNLEAAILFPMAALVVLPVFLFRLVKRGYFGVFFSGEKGQSQLEK
jgi:hypothetical protein